MTDEAVVLERVQSPRGELALRRRGDTYEIISNSVFLMDTSDGRSERLLAQVALANPPRRTVLIAGLGVGFTLAEVLRCADVETVTVVEIEEDIARWNGGPLAAINGRAVEDPRATVVVADFAEWIESAPQRFDAICLDVDNGPDWTVTDDNRRLYTTEHLETIRARLTDDGRLAIWSAAPAPEFVQRLESVFGEVQTYESPTVTGPPDLIWVVHA